MDLSAELDKNLDPSLENATPLIVWLWSYKDIKLYLCEISHIFIYPSWAPEINLFKAKGHLANTLIPSEWPYKVPRNGFEKILFNFVALKALWNYRALENGCSALGVLTTDEVGVWVMVCIFTIVEAWLL